MPIWTVKLNPQDKERSSQAPAALAQEMSHVLHVKARSHFWQGEGALSLKSFFRGNAYYDVGTGRYAVNQDSYLILNKGQHYSITVDSEREVESFCIFFETGFAEQVLYTLSAGLSELLDEPDRVSDREINFFEKTYRHDYLVSPALLALRAQVAGSAEAGDWLGERLYDLMALMLQVHQSARRELAAIDAVRSSTREELYRRLHRARDFIAASYDREVTISEIARIACLSPNHLLRTFKQVFHQTPHQYLTAIRLEKAQGLLLNSDRDITEICLDVGFQSLGSFSTLFRRRFGSSPQGWRAKKGDFREAPVR